MSPEARERSFDELAKGLANSTISRRQALRWMGGALAGAAVACLPGVAFAAAGGNRACDQFCHQNFSGRQAGKCTRAGAHGTGACFECTPGIGPGPRFTTPPCGTNEEFNPETCACETVTCSPGTCARPSTCGENRNCLCVQTVEGNAACVAFAACSALQTCTATTDCPAGYACTASTCCLGRVCIAPCAGTSGLTAARFAGPTTLGG